MNGSEGCEWQWTVWGFVPSERCVGQTIVPLRVRSTMLLLWAVMIVLQRASVDDGLKSYVSAHLGQININHHHQTECGKTVQTPAAIDRCRAARRAIGAVERRRSGVSWDLGPSRPLPIAPQPSQTFSPESA